MILNELFESGMKRVMDTVRDFVELTDKEFTQVHGISPVTWVRQNQSLLTSIANQYPAIKKYIPAPDDHLFKEDAIVENLRKWFKEKWVRFGPDGKIRGDCARGSDSEGKPKCLPQSKAHAMGKKGRASAAAKKRREDPNPERRGPAKNVATKVNELDKSTLASYVKKAAPDRYNRIPNDLMQMKDAEKNRRQWVTRDKGIAQALDKLSKEVKEESQDDRNARIIAGEIEDAMSQGNEELAKQKIKQLIQVGYTLDKDGRLQRMGMYEESNLQEKQDACYHKVKSRYKVWPSAYASGALVQCRKKGAANWGKGSKKK